MPETRRRSTPIGRILAAVLAVVALVAGGSIAAAPAFAVGPTLFLDADDWGNAGAPIAGLDMTAVNIDTHVAVTSTTDAAGDINFTLDPGTYDVTTEDDGVFKVQTLRFTVTAGHTTNSGFNLVRHAVFTGTLPAAAVGHTTISAYIYGFPWQLVPSTTTWAGNAFTVVLNDNALGSFNYNATLFFDVDDTIPYADTYLGGRTDFPMGGGGAGNATTSIAGPVSVDPVGLIAIGTIEGHVDGPFGHIQGATAKATPDGGTTIYTATTASDGSYVIRVPAADESYATWVSADGYSEPPTSTSVTLNGTNDHVVADIDFSLHTVAPTLSGNAIDQGGDPVQAGYYLYAKDAATGLYGTPSYQGTADTFDFSGVDYGTYRLALQDESGLWLPVTSYSASNTVAGTTVTGPSTVSSTRAGGDCYIEFTTAADEGDYAFADIAVDTAADSTACDQSAAAGTFSGTVTDAATIGSPLTASLFSTSDRYNAIDTVPVDSSGNFVLQGVASDDDYFVLIQAGESVPWFDTLSGDVTTMDLANIDDAVDVIVGVPLTAGEDSTGNTVDMVPATVFTGIVSSQGTPLEDACVLATDHDDPTLAYCDLTDASGRYYVKAPIFHDYTLTASTPGYDDLTYADPAHPANSMIWGSTPPTTYSSIDFDLTPWDAFIYGYGSIDPIAPVPAEGVTAHLYTRAGTGYLEVATTELDAYGYFYLGDDNLPPDFNGLAAGDYRIRFEDAAHHWLQVADYSIGSAATVSTPGCLVDLPAVGPGVPIYLGVTLSTAAGCTDEPTAPAGTVTGSLVESSLFGGLGVSAQPVQLVRDSDGLTYSATTVVGGAFSIAGVQPGVYSLVIPTRDYATGTHVYVEQTVDGVAVAGGATIPPTTLARYGNVTGVFDGWVDDPTLDPTTVTVYAFNGFDWSPVNGISGQVAADGSFEVPGIDLDDDYSLFVDGPDGSPWVDSFIDSGPNEPLPGSTFVGTAEEDTNLGHIALQFARTLSGTITDDLGQPIAGVDVIGVPDFAFDPSNPYSQPVAWHATTDAAGHYTLKVASGYEYVILAFADDYILGYWEDFSGCGCGGLGLIPADTLGDPPVTGLDITLYTIMLDTYDYFEDAGTYPGYPGVTTHLYKKVTGGYQEVNTKLSDAGGFGLISAHTPGDYRVRFSLGNQWVPVQEYFDYSIDNDPHTPTAACYVDLDGLIATDYIELDFQLDELASAGACSAEPAIIASSSSGSGTTTHHHSGVTPSPTATATPSATPSPSPSASEAPAAPTEPGRPDKPSATPAHPAPGVAWWVWLLAALGVLIVGGCGFFFLRRRP